MKNWWTYALATAVRLGVNCGKGILSVWRSCAFVIEICLHFAEAGVRSSEFKRKEKKKEKLVLSDVTTKMGKILQEIVGLSSFKKSTPNLNITFWIAFT